MGKVILTKEQAEAIDVVLEVVNEKHTLCQKEDVIIQRARGEEYSKYDRLEPLNDLSFDTLIRALYIGYEVEQTPEEKVREYYEALEQTFKDHSIPASFHKMEAVRHTLELLNIKIEGVNDDAPHKDKITT